MLKSKWKMAVLIILLVIFGTVVIITQQREKIMPSLPNKTAENDFVIFAKYETSNQLDPSNLQPLHLNTYLYNSGKLIKEGNFYEGRKNLETQIDKERMEKIRAIVKELIARKDCSGGQLEPSGSLNYILRFDGEEKKLTGHTSCSEELGKIKELLHLKARWYLPYF